MSEDNSDLAAPVEDSIEISNTDGSLGSHAQAGTSNLEVDLYKHEVPPVVEIERDLDNLTYSGSTINDLEIQLTQSKHLYQTTLKESRRRVDLLRQSLSSHIKKADPFIEIWRKTRKIQDESNKAAMKFDKASSQHAASKEMIRVAEEQLSVCATANEPEPSSPSPLNLAWQEMLNHATLKVVDTERERRACELEHRAILVKVNSVLEEYRNTEKRLRNHITKARPYHEQRFKANQQLQLIQRHIEDLESKIQESKRAYSATLRRLETLNAEIHHRRAFNKTIQLNIRRYGSSSSLGSTPKRQMQLMDGYNDTTSLDSLQVPGEFTGSIEFMQSLGDSTTSDIGSNSENLTEAVAGSLPATSESKDIKPLVVDGAESSHIAEESHEEKKRIAAELVDKCLAVALSQVEESIEKS